MNPILTFVVVGTMRYVELKPGLLASLFPPTLALQVPDHSAMFIPRNDGPMHHSKGKSGDYTNNVADDEFSDDGLNDQDLLNAGKYTNSLLIFQ
jgi:hypothetical protein